MENDLLSSDLTPTQTLKELLAKTAQRFLSGKVATLRAQFRHELAEIGNGEFIDDLIRLKFLEYPDANHIVPGLLTFAKTTRELQGQGQRGTDLVIKACHQLFIQDYRTLKFSKETVLQAIGAATRQSFALVAGLRREWASSSLQSSGRRTGAILKQ